MRKIYTSLAVLVSASVGLTGCHSSTTTVSSSTAPQQQKIDEINTHIRGLSKDFWSALTKWRELTSERTVIGNRWMHDIQKKYDDINRNCLNTLCKQQEEAYSKYTNSISMYPGSGSSREPAWNLDYDFVRTNHDGFFEYDPAKVQDKRELLIKVDGFQQKVDKVRLLLNRGIVDWWYKGVAPEWMSVVQDLRTKMAREDVQIAIARHDLVAIREWIEGLPV